VNKIIKNLKIAFSKYIDWRINRRWTRLDYILSQDFNPELIEEYSQIIEVEHQVGRYLNMRNIFNQLEVQNVEGDIVEFGTWQGLGLIYFSRLLGSNINRRKLVGIDSFEGLPESSTIWRKGDFNNTALEYAYDNVNRYADPRFRKEDILLIKGWFGDEKTSQQLNNQVRKIALVHFDADLGSSTAKALKMIEPYLNDGVGSFYFLFDDWGCHPDEVPDAFFSWLDDFKKTRLIVVEKISSTRFTRYYKITV
jgi:hypothetical protein